MPVETPPLVTGVKEQDPTGPLTFELTQNYPNPFNPATTMEFAVPREVRVRLEVFNVLGQSIAVLADGVHTAGYHRVSFDASSEPSGLYLYRLSGDGITLTMKMALVR
jgi:hypothetical protein